MGIGDFPSGIGAHISGQTMDQFGKGGDPENKQQDTGDLEKDVPQGDPFGIP